MLPDVEAHPFVMLTLRFVWHTQRAFECHFSWQRQTFGALGSSLLVECTTFIDVRVPLSWRTQHLVIYWSAFEGHTGPANSTAPNVFATGVGGSQLWDWGI